MTTPRCNYPRADSAVAWHTSFATPPACIRPPVPLSFRNLSPHGAAEVNPIMTVGRQEPGLPVSRSAFDVDYRGTEDPDPQRAQDSREGHGFARSSDRPADQADHRVDRAP